MTATCTNLKKRFPEYRITLDPAAEDGRDPWYYQIPGRKGTIYPYGGDWLAVEIDNRRGVVEQMIKVPTVLHTQNGDTEHTFIFAVEYLRQVATIVGSRKRRKRNTSPEALAKLKANLVKTRAAKRGSKSTKKRLTAS